MIYLLLNFSSDSELKSEVIHRHSRYLALRYK